MRPRALRAAGAMIAAVLLALILFWPSSSPGDAGRAGGGLPEGEAVRAAREVRSLEVQAALAREDGFYLVLDPAGRSLSLMYRGLLANRWDLSGMEVLQRRILFLRRAQVEDWTGRRWIRGRLLPPRPRVRPEMIVDSSGKRLKGEPPSILPTPEEMIPPPDRYRLLFDGGLALEFRPVREGAGSRWFGWVGGILEAAGDASTVFLSLGAESLRLRLSLAPDDAGWIYRSLPPEPALVILPG